MDAPFQRRPDRPPSRLRRARLGAAVLLLAAAGFAGGETPRFGLHATLQSKPAVPTGGGFALHAKLTPATHTVQGGSYSVDAIAAPMGSCDANDKIFVNGFELTIFR